MVLCPSHIERKIVQGKNGIDCRTHHPLKEEPVGVKLQSRGREGARANTIMIPWIMPPS